MASEEARWMLSALSRSSVPLLCTMGPLSLAAGLAPGPRCPGNPGIKRGEKVGCQAGFVLSVALEACFPLAWEACLWVPNRNCPTESTTRGFQRHPGEVPCLPARERGLGGNPSLPHENPSFLGESWALECRPKGGDIL